MSAMTMEVRPIVTVPTIGPITLSHPRGRGFGVLSRIAREQSSESDYEPRHRADVPAELAHWPALAV